MQDARRRKRGLLVAGSATKRHPISGECTMFGAKVPYFEQMSEILDPQVTHDKLFAWTKANRRSMDLVEFWRRRWTVDPEQWSVMGLRLWGLFIFRFCAFGK